MFLSILLAAATDNTLANAVKSHFTPDVVLNIIYLMFLSSAGIMLHWFVDLKKAKAQDMAFTMKHYIASTWDSSVISFVLCSLAVMLRHELASNVPTFSAWEGTIFAILGYFGDSILPLIFGFAKSKGLDLTAIADDKK